MVSLTGVIKTDKNANVSEFTSLYIKTRVVTFGVKKCYNSR